MAPSETSSGRHAGDGMEGQVGLGDPWLPSQSCNSELGHVGRWVSALLCTQLPDWDFFML